MSRHDTLQTSMSEAGVTVGKDLYKNHKKQVMAPLVDGGSQGSPVLQTVSAAATSRRQ